MANPIIENDRRHKAKEAGMSFFLDREMQQKFVKVASCQ